MKHNLKKGDKTVKIWVNYGLERWKMNYQPETRT